jgi:hypothetical protein
VKTGYDLIGKIRLRSADRGGNIPAVALTVASVVGVQRQIGAGSAE